MKVKRNNFYQIKVSSHIHGLIMKLNYNKKNFHNMMIFMMSYQNKILNKKIINLVNKCITVFNVNLFMTLLHFTSS